MAISVSWTSPLVSSQLVTASLKLLEKPSDEARTGRFELGSEAPVRPSHLSRVPTCQCAIGRQAGTRLLPDLDCCISLDPESPSLFSAASTDIYVNEKLSIMHNNAHLFRETSRMRHCGHRRIAYAYTEDAGFNQRFRGFDVSHKGSYAIFSPLDGVLERLGSLS